MSDRPSLDLFRAMFPGDPARGAPAAAATGAVDGLVTQFDELSDVDALLLEREPGDVTDDPNETLKLLKAKAPELVDRFVERAIVAYFSDPAVSRALTGKASPLFPNHTVMPDIDFDLLEPVLANCRGHADE